MQNQSPAPIQRTSDHLPMVSAEDAANLSNFFIDKYLIQCRCITPEEVVRCLGMLTDRVEEVTERMIMAVQPVADSHDHEHEVIEQEAAPASGVVREPINKHKTPSNSSRRRNKARNS